MKASPYSGSRQGQFVGRTVSAAGSASNGAFWLYMYFLVDYFLHLSQRFSFYGHLRPTLVLFALLCGVLFVQREKLAGKATDPIFQAIFVLLGYIVISLLLVEFPGSVIRHNIPDFVKAIMFLFFTALVIDSEKRLKIFLFVYVGCQVVRVLEPMYLHVTQGYWGGETYLGHGDFAERLSGAPSDLVNPNGLGFVLVTAIPFLHYLLFTGRWKAKLLYLSLMPCLLYALILTMSRGALLAFLVVAWMVFKESTHKMLLILVAIGIAIGGWSVMNANQKDRYLSLVSSDAESSQGVDGRLSLIVHEFKLGLERPVVGHGLGTTSEAKYHSWGRRQASHNMYGELLIELGLIGSVIFLVFIARIYRRFRANGELLKQMEGEARVRFYSNLNKALIAVFWMYALYSLNYYGLSQYYWYLFGGLAIVFGRQIEMLARDRSNEKVPEQESLKKGIEPQGISKRPTLRERSRDWARVMR